MKKLLSLVLTIALIVCAVPLGAFTLTASAATDGYYTYTITDGKATITAVDTSISGDITIPSTLGGYPVISIGFSAVNHTAITSVTIPDSVISIDDDAFYGCENLTSVTMSDSVTSIGNYAFCGCENLTSVTMSDSVTSIGNFAFYGCENLTSITLPDSVTSIGSAVFYASGYYGDDSNWIDNALYCGNHLIAVNDLISGNYTVKTNIKTIAADAFGAGNLLTSISVDKNNNNYSSIDGVLFNKNATIIIQYPLGKTDASYTIPNSVISIGDNAFLGSDLIDITVPDSVKNIGDDAFSYCINLTTIRLGCNVMNIGYSAFSDCYGLTSITLPYSVTSIGPSSFRGCYNLMSVSIGDNVTSIGESAFDDCFALTDIWYTGSQSDRGNINIDNFNAEELKNATWHYNTCNVDEHVYSNNNDTTCQNCEWVRTVEEKYYGSWVINPTKTGVYKILLSILTKSSLISEDIAVFDEHNNEVKYNEIKQGWPLVEGQEYNLRLNVDYGNVDNINWSLTKTADTIFTDTLTAEKGGWYNDAVTYSVGAGLITGYGGTNLFGTADNIQRQDFVVILARLAGVDLENYQSNRASFADVPSGAYYEKAILWAADCGITTGYNDGTNRFGVGDKITREQLVTFLYRYAKYINGGMAPTVSADAEQKAQNYADYNGVTDYAQEAIIWALDKGVISGQGGTKCTV